MQAARFPPAPRRLATAQQLELEDSTLEYDLSRFDSVPTPSTAVAEKIFNDPNAWFGSTLAKFGESQERQNSLAASPEADKTTFVEVAPTSAISSAKPKSSSQSSTDSTESTDSTDSSVSIKPFTRKRTVLPESPTSSSSSSGRSSAAFWSSDGRSSGAESDITVDSDSAKLKPEALRASRLSISFFWSEKNLFRALPSPAAPSPLTPGAGFASLAKSTHLFVPGAPLPAQEMKQRRRSNSVDGFQFTVPPLKLSKRQNSNSVPSPPIVEVQVEMPSPRNPDVQTLKIQNSLSAPPSPISTNAPLLESMTSPPAANSAPPSPLPTDAPMSLFQGSPRMRPTGPRLGPRPLPTPSGHRKSASLVSSNPSLLLASPVQSSAPLSDEKSSLPLGDPPPYTDAPGASASQQIPLPTTTTPSAPLRQARPNPSLVARPQSEFNSSEVESVPSIEEMRASVAALPMVPALRKRRSRAALSMAARPHSSVDPDAAATAGVQGSEGQGRLPLPGIPPSVPLPPLPPPIPQSGLPSRAMMRRPSVSRMQYKSEAQGQEKQPIVPVPLQNEPDLWPKPAPTLKSAMKKPSMDSATPPLPSMGFSRPQEQTLPRSESPAPIVAPTPSSSNPPIQMDLVNQKLEATGPAPSPASTLERGKSERGRRSPFPAAKRRGLPSRETSPSESVRSNSTTTTTTSSISEPVTRSVTPVQNGPFSSMGTQPVPTRSTTPVPLPPPVPSNPVQQQEIEPPRPQPPSTISTPTASRPPQQPTPVPTPAPSQKPVSILRPTRSKSRIRFAEGVKTKTHGHSASQPDFLNRPPEEGWKGRLPPQRQPTLPYPQSERLGVPNGGNGARSRSPSPVRSEISNGDEVEVGRERGRSPSPALSMASSNGGGEGLRHVRSVSASTVTTSTTGRRPTLKRQPSQGLPSHPGVHRRGTSVGPTATTTAAIEDKNPEVPPQQPSPETPIPPVPTPQPVEAPAPPVATEPPPVVAPVVPDEPPVPATPPIPAPPPAASPAPPPPQVPQVSRTKSTLRAPSPSMGPPVPQMPPASSSLGPNTGLVPKKSILKNSSSFDRSASPQPSYPPHVRSASASTTVGSRKSAVLPRPSSAFRQDPSAGAPPMPSSTMTPQRPASPALSNASEPPPAPPRNPMRQRSMSHSRSMSNLQAPRPAMPLRPSSPALSAASEPPSQTQSQPGGPPKRPPRPLSHARSLSSLKNPPAQLAPPLPAPNRAPSPSPMLMGGAGSGGGEHGRSASTGEALPTDVVRGLRSRANSVTGKRPAMPELVPF